MKQVKQAVAALVNDIHLTKENTNLVKDIMCQVFSLCAERNIESVYIGGDVFTSRSAQPLECLTAWNEILNDAAERGINITAIPGNHDKTDADDERSYLDVYSSSMTLCRDARLFYNRGLVVGFIPYFSEERWLEEYKRLEDSFLQYHLLANKENTKEEILPKILITHIGFDGVTNNDGSAVESRIKPSMFKQWDKVLIGHYHDAQQLGDNVLYTGSAYQGNYGESVNYKGCTLIYNDASLEFVQLKFPRYIRETLDVNDTETLQNLIEKYEGETYDHIRFVFCGLRADANKVDVAGLSKIGIDARFVPTEEENAVTTALCVEEGKISFSKASLLEDFKKFCEENNIPKQKVDYGLNLLNVI